MKRDRERNFSFLKLKRFHIQGERGPDGVTGVPGPRGDKVHDQRTDLKF